MTEGATSRHLPMDHPEPCAVCGQETHNVDLYHELPLCPGACTEERDRQFQAALNALPEMEEAFG